MSDTGYLQHSAGPNGPFRTESVAIKQDVWPNADKWLAHFEGRWRRVHVQVNRTFIVYRGERINILIYGV